MLRRVVRLIAFLLLAGAFAGVVIDGAKSIAADRLLVTTLDETRYWAKPALFPLLQPFVEKRLGQVAWDPILVNILKAPTFVVFALLGAGLLYLVRRRPPPIGYSSRRR